MADHRQRHLAGDDPVRTLLVHAPRLIASCNVAHSRENDVTGPRLDLQYLASLGPQALPPVEASVHRIPALWSIARHYRPTHETPATRCKSAGLEFSDVAS